MSQEEHILHELKEMHKWTAHADRAISSIKWSLLGMLFIMIAIIWILLVK